MKKITLTLALLCAVVFGSFAQVQVGIGNNQSQNMPIEAYFGYTYAQSIYLASEIDASGQITGIQYYFSGTSTLPDSQQWVVYLAHSSRESYETSADWEDISNFTQVYSGGFPVTGPGWYTITFETPFEYNGTDNLIIAVEEDQAAFDESGDDFWNSAVAGNRSIYAYSDTVNIDSTDPNNNQGGFPTRGISAFVPTIIFNGITQACPNTGAVTFSAISSTGATVGWATNGTETAWEVLILEAGAPAPDSSTSGEAVTGNPSYTTSNLTTATNYSVYVRAICSTSSTSLWVGPFNFLTLCEPFTELSVDFESAASGTTPDCFTRIVNSTSEFASAGVVTFSGANNTARSYQLNNSGDANAQIALVSPPLAQLSAGTHRVKFYANGFGGDPIEVGTMSNPNDISTFTLVETIVTNDGWSLETVPFPATTDMYIAFKHGGGGTFSTLRVDEIVWEEVPAVTPECVSDAVVISDEGCGNFENVIEWSAVENADGYRITIGTTPGGIDIVNNEDIGLVTEFSFIGAIDTTYYFTVNAFSDFAPATGCIEQSFTTAATGCYCVAAPVSVDNDGITTIVIGQTEYQIPTVTYQDNSSEVVELNTGVVNNLQITFATGFTYNTYVVIDLNNDFNFSADEILFSGVSLATNPTVFDASFLLSANAPLGEHRMRIVTADSMSLENFDPCYDGTWAAIVDFTVNIVQPSCSPAQATATVVPNCADNQYSVQVVVTDLGDGTPSISDGTNETAITAVGTYTVGPYENLSQVTLSIVHGVDDVCNVPLGNFTFTCPPSNDNCSNAIAMEVNEDFGCATTYQGTLAGATASVVDATLCSGAEDDDVWFSFVATASSHRIVLTTPTFIDLAHSLWTGTCDGLTLVPGTCSDPNTSNPSNLNIGDTYYVRVNSFGTAAQTGGFTICVGTPPPPPANDECDGAIAMAVGSSIDESPIDVTNGGATGSAVPNPTTCFGYLGGDVWCVIEIPDSGSVTIQTANSSTGASGVDTVVTAYAGSCGELTQIGCDDDGAPTANYSFLTLSNRTPGELIYLRVYEYNNDNVGTFSISAFDLPLSTDNFNSENLSAYPNPVKDVLNLKYNTNISNVAVFNIIGQQVLTQEVNAADAKVDMSKLAAGTYVVKVTADNMTKTMKVIKN